MNNLLIIDGTNILKQSYYACKDESVSIGIFLNSVMNASEMLNANEIVVAWDDPRNWRKEFYSGYKADRKHDMEEELFIEKIRCGLDLILLHSGLASLRFAGYEADDIIANIVVIFPPENRTYYIMSSDTDLWALIGPNVKCIRRSRIIGIVDVKKEFNGLCPHHVWLHKALKGGHDNIKGVPGIGKKRGIDFIKHDPEFADRLCKEYWAYHNLKSACMPTRSGITTKKIHFDACYQNEQQIKQDLNVVMPGLIPEEQFMQAITCMRSALPDRPALITDLDKYGYREFSRYMAFTARRKELDRSVDRNNG